MTAKTKRTPKVVPIRPSVVPRPGAPCRDVVRLLRKLLKEAERGEIRAIAAAGVDGARRGFSDVIGEYGTALSLLGSMRLCERSMMSATWPND